MPKPSIIQIILNKPSQSYRSEQLATNEYHSIKSEMVRAAIDSNSSQNYHVQYSHNSETDPGAVSLSDHRHLVPFHTHNHSEVDDAALLASPSSLHFPLARADSALAMPVEYCQVSASPSPSSSTHDLTSLAAFGASKAIPPEPTVALRSTMSALTRSSDYSRYSWCSTNSTKPDSSEENLFEKQTPDRTGSVHRRRRNTIDIEQRRRKALSEPSLDDWAKDVRWLVPPSDIHRGFSVSSPVKRGEQTYGPEPLMRYNSSRRSKSKRSRRGQDLSRSEEFLSALWEENEDDEASTPSDSYLDHATPTEAPITVRVRTKSAPQLVPALGITQISSSGDTDSSETRVSDNSVSTSVANSNRKVDLPIPLPVSNGGEPTGYTSLILPHAAPLAPKRYSIFFSRSALDLSRSGLAQTTMSTVSMTKDAGVAALMKTRRLPIFRRSSTSTLSPTPEHLQVNLPSPLSFTSYLAPPRKVLSNQVLIQVWAVGLDGLDRMIVRDKSGRSSNYGFIPGRSFVGRVVECGYAVNGISKSDWVIGLLDARKSGALAEFIVTDKTRVAKCFRPSKSLSVEQLAMLPLCGISAHRAVRTFGFPERGAHALVLQAHDGAGALAVQELVSQGISVTAQVSPDFEERNERDVSEESGSLSVRDRILQFGAQKVLVYDPLTAVEVLEDNTYDLVIDTVGGREVWEACRRVLHNTGQFTTLVGDYDQAIPTMNAIFKSNLRSLKRAFVKKNHKSLSYAFVSPIMDVDSEGEDIRKSLSTVLKLAADGILRPWIEKWMIYSFEQAPVLFSATPKESLRNGRTAIIRIIDY